MKEILIFAGTTEGRKLSECLVASGISHTVCVATEYGEIVLNEHPLAKVRRGRMSRKEIRQYIRKGDFAAVVDATHPYADVITENIRLAVKGTDILYLRLRRETDAEENYEKIVRFADNEACVEALAKTEGNILLTTGSKELAVYCASKEIKNRLYVRVLPGIESLSLCMEQGIAGKQILALQGPFTVEMNEAMLRQYRIKCLVTKASGRAGGYQEKVEAAKRRDIPVFVIGLPGVDEGLSFREVCQRLEKVCGKAIRQNKRLEIILAGVGMGSRGTLTREVCEAIDRADILLGAERMLAPYQPRLEKKPLYRAEEIIPYLKEMQEGVFSLETGNVVILFSGDSGFYSGCQALYRALLEQIMSGGLDASIRILPGISSVACLAACVGESYQDAAIYSMHGKKLSNLIRRIQREKKTFLLMSGVRDLNLLGKQLLENGMNGCKVVVGYQMSYPDQQIRTMTPKECVQAEAEGLYTCFIRNLGAKDGMLTHGVSDSEFIRDKIPMTKEEVREVSICKLKLHRNAVVYDIGSGTGSIAVEIARLSDGIQVFALERKAEAIELIEKNKEKFCLENISVVQCEAPDGFDRLPVPTHAFIGGSGGRLKEILSALYRMNCEMRVVINAISVETICEIKEILALYPVENEEIVQIQVGRAKKAGQYHLMQAENPVWICAFHFRRQ